MGNALFYHLTRRPLEATLPMLLEKSLAAGWRVAVRGTDAGRLDWLDERLWMGDGFLPHGRAGGGFDADQPVLLTTAPEMPNRAACLMAVDGAEVAAAEAEALERVCILFDGNDPAAVDHARGQWRALTGAGVPAQYWSEESGRWEKKAESAAPQG
ncbi:DNA polymerase III subunit chi [Rhodovulum adriaticum]|uniref:DNA polymerase III chi subunit n=1 Tax=Rhodovulum adriaticum TaxID=35804 RepID=A0A4R2NNU2_RHOAD|nr:DNA polymerase III subunit chi [Rhodovulum adriaticum]MBK1634519.1 DNA polymerase III subunit chi [Rhodovulum adriaticum]TCP23111.1 DNA polymerase III chi subunit [Rhodovulum adriaticum]